MAATLFLNGCGQESITTYRVPKEAPAPSATAHSEQDGHNHGPSAPRISWKVPAGWEEMAPGEMRAATFRIADGGKAVDVGIVPLPGLAGKDLDNVNRWRGQVGAAPITEEEMNKIGQPVTIAGQETKLFEQAGENPASGDKTRILAAILRKDGVAWFFKATGEDDLVARNKASFLDFLKSVQFGQTPELPADHPPVAGMPGGPSGAPSASVADTGNRPEWQVPGGWKEVPGGQFLVAKFSLGGEKPAAVNVSTSAGDGGGLLGNVNRWRKQIGLEDLSSTEVEKLVTAIETPAGKASLVDLSGTDARTGQKTRVIGAVLPIKNETWFYKLMGDAQTVEQEKAAFTQFIQSAKYPHAR